MQYYKPASKVHIKKERTKALKLKKSNWWKQKLQSKTCFYCKKTFCLKDLTMDHKVPIVKGGKSQKSNVVVSCKKCNTQKGTKTSAELILDSIN